MGEIRELLTDLLFSIVFFGVIASFIFLIGSLAITPNFQPPESVDEPVQEKYTVDVIDATNIDSDNAVSISEYGEQEEHLIRDALRDDMTSSEQFEEQLELEEEQIISIENTEFLVVVEHEQQPETSETHKTIVYMFSASPLIIPGFVFTVLIIKISRYVLHSIIGVTKIEK